jgi:hypothetical protein
VVAASRMRDGCLRKRTVRSLRVGQDETSGPGVTAL